MNTEDCVYAAGFVDGEGCITTAAANFRITIGSTDLCILEWFATTFGGNINNAHLPDNPKWNKAWKWVMATKSGVAEFLTLIYPYLKLKKDQAKAVLDFLEKYPGYPTKAMREQRKRDFNLVKTKLKSLKTDKHYVR